VVRYIFELRKSAKYILVEHARRKCVVRTRNPFLVSEVITYGTGQITFDLWPDEVVKSLNESQIDTLTSSMARRHAAVEPSPPQCGP
jgi:hypothetical protein